MYARMLLLLLVTFIFTSMLLYYYQQLQLRPATTIVISNFNVHAHTFVIVSNFLTRAHGNIIIISNAYDRWNAIIIVSNFYVRVYAIITSGVCSQLHVHKALFCPPCCVGLNYEEEKLFTRYNGVVILWLLISAWLLFEVKEKPYEKGTVRICDLVSFRMNLFDYCVFVRLSDSCRVRLIMILQ